MTAFAIAHSHDENLLISAFGRIYIKDFHVRFHKYSD